MWAGNPEISSALAWLHRWMKIFHQSESWRFHRSVLILPLQVKLCLKMRCQCWAGELSGSPPTCCPGIAVSVELSNYKKRPLHNGLRSRLPDRTGRGPEGRTLPWGWERSRTPLPTQCCAHRGTEHIKYPQDTKRLIFTALQPTHTHTRRSPTPEMEHR